MWKEREGGSCPGSMSVSRACVRLLKTTRCSLFSDGENQQTRFPDMRESHRRLESRLIIPSKTSPSTFPQILDSTCVSNNELILLSFPAGPCFQVSGVSICRPTRACAHSNCHLLLSLANSRASTPCMPGNAPTPPTLTVPSTDMDMWHLGLLWTMSGSDFTVMLSALSKGLVPTFSTHASLSQPLVSARI